MYRIKNYNTEYNIYTLLIPLNSILLAFPILIKEILFHQFYHFLLNHSHQLIYYYFPPDVCMDDIITVSCHIAFSMRPSPATLQPPIPTLSTLLYLFLSTILYYITIYYLYIYFCLPHWTINSLRAKKGFFSLIYPKHLEWYLLQSRCSVNIC